MTALQVGEGRRLYLILSYYLVTLISFKTILLKSSFLYDRAHMCLWVFLWYCWRSQPQHMVAHIYIFIVLLLEGPLLPSLCSTWMKSQLKFGCLGWHVGDFWPLDSIRKISQPSLELEQRTPHPPFLHAAHSATTSKQLEMAYATPQMVNGWYAWKNYMSYLFFKTGWQHQNTVCKTFYQIWLSRDLPVNMTGSMTWVREEGWEESHAACHNKDCHHQHHTAALAAT